MSTTHGTSTLTMAIRTATSRAATALSGQSATITHIPCDIEPEELFQAYFDCRKRKRNTQSARAFEINLESNLADLFHELTSGTYVIGKSVCFVVTKPKPREVWAADFRDRIVHHLIYNRIAQKLHKGFIVDSCACIPERGTLYGAKRAYNHAASVTDNWHSNGYYLKLDLSNFFNSIDKNVLDDILTKKIHNDWVLSLTKLILWHDPRKNYSINCCSEKLKLIPPNKSLFNNDTNKGLPIGNLSSQLFANVLLDRLDQFIKRQLSCKHYVRYVDDFILMSKNKSELLSWLEKIETFIEAIGVRLNDKKTILQPIVRGFDFVGHTIKPYARFIKKATFETSIKALKNTNDGKIINSYFGLVRQGKNSFRQQRKVALVALKNGLCVTAKFNKSFGGKNETY